MRTTLTLLASFTLVLGACGGAQHSEDISPPAEVAPIQHTEPEPVAPAAPTDQPSGEAIGHADFPPPLPPPNFATDGTPVDAADFVLLGVWGMDVVAMVEQAIAGMPADIPDELRMEMEMQLAMAERMHMSFEFREGSAVEIRMTMMGETHSDEGLYDVTSRDGDTISIVMAPVDASEEAETIVFTIVDSNTLHSEDDEGQMLLLRRLE